LDYGIKEKKLYEERKYLEKVQESCEENLDQIAQNIEDVDALETTSSDQEIPSGEAKQHYKRWNIY